MNDVKSVNKKPKSNIVVPKTEVTLKQVESSQKFYLIAGSILFLIIAVGGFFGYKLFNNLIQELNKVKAQDKTIGLLEEKKDALEQLKEPYNKIKEKKGTDSDADLILRALPEKEEYRSLIAMMENIANVSGVKLLSVSSSEGGSSKSSSSSSSSSSGSGKSGTTSSTSSQSGSTQAQPYVFTVGISGPYDRIIQFLKNTEKSARVINFNDMDLSGTNNDVQANLTMQTYWQAPADISDKEENLK